MIRLWLVKDPGFTTVTPGTHEAISAATVDTFGRRTETPPLPLTIPTGPMSGSSHTGRDMTALAAMIGAATILPDPIFQGLAISLLFGLASSTLLTVLVIPAIYIALRDDQKPAQQSADG